MAKSYSLLLYFLLRILNPFDLCTHLNFFHHSSSLKPSNIYNMYLQVADVVKISLIFDIMPIINALPNIIRFVANCKFDHSSFSY